jgi:hypothetical protein
MAKKKQKKLYLTRVTVDVLSEEPIDFNGSLDDLNYQITDGDCSGVVKQGKAKVLKGKAAVKAVKSQASDTDFFRMDDKGNELDD